MTNNNIIKNRYELFKLIKEKERKWEKYFIY